MPNMDTHSVNIISIRIETRQAIKFVAVEVFLLLLLFIIIIIIINFFYIGNHINIFYKIFTLQ